MHEGLLSRRGLAHPALAESPHDILDAALPVVGRGHAGGALALLDGVRALLEVLEAALVHLGLGVGAEGGVGLVVLAALDAVLRSANVGQDKALKMRFVELEGRSRRKDNVL